MADTSSENVCRPRRDVLVDSDYFMAVALLAEKRSSESTKRAGACVVKDSNVVAVGHNQMLKGYDDENRHLFELHAEVDAIMNCSDAKGCTLYVTVYPCNDCIKLIIQSGVRAVVFLRKDKEAKQNKVNASVKMFYEADVQCKDFNDKRPSQTENLQIKFKNETQTAEAQSKRRRSDISDSDFFMGVAVLTAMRSRDPTTQVGACVVKNNTVSAVGHNQMPKGENHKYTWARGNPDADSKYLYVCHAEPVALGNAPGVNGGSIFITLFPCYDCARLLIRAGVKTAVFLSDKYTNEDYVKAPDAMLEENGLHVEAFYEDDEPEREPVLIEFE